MEKCVCDRDLQSIVTLSEANKERYRQLLNRLNPRSDKNRRVAINSVIKPTLDRRNKLNLDRRRK